MIKINYHKITKFDTANGVGIRSVLWVSGCSHKCKGCHNPETWDPNSGKKFTEDTMEELLESLSPDYISGLTISGGDPFYVDNRFVVFAIVYKVKTLYPKKSIWLYTGYKFEDIKDYDILKYIDVLVDGEFILNKKDITLPYCGSTNQRVIDVVKTLDSNEIVLY